MPASIRPKPLIGAVIAAAAVLYAANRPNPPPRIHAPIAPHQPSWCRILVNVSNELSRDYISVMAAGVAFYSFLSVFPGMSALISVYGLIADPRVIEEQLASLAGVLPQQALGLISDQLHNLIAAPSGRLGIGLIVSLLLTLWSAMSGTGTLMEALTAAYEERETRGIIGFYLRAFLLTVALGLFALVSLLLIAGVPAVVDRLPLAQPWQYGMALIRWPILAGLVLVALGIVYRFGPARRTPRWHWLGAGNIAAAALWLAGSAGFSFYVARFASYNKTYGSLGAVVVLLIWFYLSAYIVLAGAELNSEIEKARAGTAKS